MTSLTFTYKEIKVQENLEMHTDIGLINSKADIMQKRICNPGARQQFILLGRQLRTLAMLNILSHNSFLMKEKGYLIYEKGMTFNHPFQWS